MSIYPCDVHHSRVVGPLSAAYFGLLRGADRSGRKLRLCSTCLDAILTSDGSHWASIDGDGQSQDFDVCTACQANVQPPEVAYPLFVTVYRKGSDRVDYYGNYCQSCAERLVERYALT